MALMRALMLLLLRLLFCIIDSKKWQACKKEKEIMR